MAKFVKCSTHSCPEPEQAIWFLAARGSLDCWSKWTGMVEECPINWQHGRNIELGQKFVLSAWQSLFNAFQCSALSGSELEQATWFLVATGFLQIFTQKHQKQNTLPKTRFKVSGKLRLFNSQHCEGDTLHWPDPLRTWKLWREWFSHSGHLLTPACVPFLQYLQCSAGDRFELNWWKNASHSSIRTKNPLPNTRFKVSGKLQLSQLSTLPRRHYSLTWPFANLETVKRMVLSQGSVAGTCMCTLYFVQSRAKCHLVVLPWSLCNTSVFSYWQIILSKLLGWMSPSHQRGTYSLQLLEKLTRNPGSCKTREVTRKPCHCTYWQIVAALDKQMVGNTTCLGLAEDAASATKSLPDRRFFEVSGKLQLFFRSQHCREDTLHWSDLCENRNCEEDGSITVATRSYQHLCPLQNWKLKRLQRMVLSQWSLLHTCICALCSILVIQCELD